MVATEVLARGAPFDEAIEFFRQKIRMPTEVWTDIWEGMHSRAFVVAGAMRDDLLSDFQTAIAKGLQDGTTLADFRKDFDGIVKRYGWSYKGGRGWRTSVIFNTNLRTAYQAGHYKQMTDPDVLRGRPFWRYSAVMDGRTRPQHAAWHNVVLPADDPWWKTHFPPNGWGCRCMAVNHSAREIERMKAQGEKLREEAPPMDWEEREVRLPDGATQTVRVPRGIDPGWAYNVGETAWGRSEALRLMEDQGPWKAFESWGADKYGRPGKIAIDTPKESAWWPPEKTETALRDALRRAIGADEAAIVDPTGERVIVNQAIVDHILAKPSTRWDGREVFFPLIRELIEDPYEIWISFAQSEMSGRIGIRRKYVKAVRIDKNRVIGLFAEIEKGFWVSEDFFRGGLTGASNLRLGRMVYGRE